MRKWACLAACTCHASGSWGTNAAVFSKRVRRWVFWLVLNCGQVTSAFAQIPSTRPPAVGVDLTFRSENSCGTREHVLGRLRALRGHAPEPRAHVAAAIAVTRDEGGYRVSFNAHTASTRSQRELIVADCAAAIEASALLLHLALDPELSREAQKPSEPSSSSEGGTHLGAIPESAEPEPAPGTNVEPLTPQAAADSKLSEENNINPPPTPEPGRAAQPEDASTKRPRLNARHNAERSESQADQPDAHDTVSAGMTPRPWVGVGASLVSGVAPRSTLGASLEGGAALDRFDVHLQAAFHPVPRAPIAGVPNAALDSTLIRVHLGVGPLWGTHRFRAGPVLSVGMEHLSALPRGTTAPRAGSSTWWSMMLALNLRAQLVGPLGVSARAGVLSSLERPKFTVGGVPGTVHQAERFGWCAALGVMWTWNSP